VDDGDMKLRLRTLGETLRAIRVERGFSLGEVAEGTDLSTSFLSLVENGRSDISTGRLFRVARFPGWASGSCSTRCRSAR
jgi:transcriptional regulator with XRE-family HTH domain